MTNRILLYGATGYSGHLIAEEARRRIAGSSGSIQLVLGGRERRALEQMTDETEFEHVVFALDDQQVVQSVLAEFNVLLNAAGPFAATGVRLAKSAVATGCHYVDINGELDVYQALDDLGRSAEQRRVALVSGAGFTSAVSDVLLDWALSHLKSMGWTGGDLGGVRIAASGMAEFSRGSVLTMLRSLREEVLTIRRGTYQHVPIGRVERAFDFGPMSRQPSSAPPEPRIASAVNVLDTLTAFRTLTRRNAQADTIVSFAEMSRLARTGYQAGALSAVFLQLPGTQRLLQLQLAQLPDGPDAEQRAQNRQTLLLQIDSPHSEPWIDWRLETPDVYDVTARCAMATAEAVASSGSTFAGWRTPAEVLALPSPMTPVPGKQDPDSLNDPLTDCRLECRSVLAAH